MSHFLFENIHALIESLYFQNFANTKSVPERKFNNICSKWMVSWQDHTIFPVDFDTISSMTVDKEVIFILGLGTKEFETTQ